MGTRVEMRARKSGERAFRTLRYVSTEKLQQTRQVKIFTMATLLQRPPLAMFDPSLIHRNDEIFNPKPHGLGFFFASNPTAILYLGARVGSKLSACSIGPGNYGSGNTSKQVCRRLTGSASVVGRLGVVARQTAKR